MNSFHVSLHHFSPVFFWLELFRILIPINRSDSETQVLRPYVDKKKLKIINLFKNKLTNNYEENGYGDFPICIAKTQYSFSTDPTLKGAPSGHSVPIRELRLSSGAEFIVVICGEIMTLRGLPSIPAADSIILNDKGEIEGLF